MIRERAVRGNVFCVRDRKGDRGKFAEKSIPCLRTTPPIRSLQYCCAAATTTAVPPAMAHSFVRSKGERGSFWRRKRSMAYDAILGGSAASGTR